MLFCQRLEYFPLSRSNAQPNLTNVHKRTDHYMFEGVLKVLKANFSQFSAIIYYSHYDLDFSTIPKSYCCIGIIKILYIFSYQKFLAIELLEPQNAQIYMHFIILILNYFITCRSILLFRSWFVNVLCN